jgi:hypothetical protein
MYTGLDHNKIKANVREAIKEARTYANDCNAKDGRRRYDLAFELAKDTKLFDHLDFVVDNTYIRTQGGIFKHQVIGLSMSTNSAQELADLTTYIDERNFIDELLKNKEEEEEEEAKKQSNNFQLIDDILTWGAEPPSPEIYGLQWSETTIEHGYVVYLGANIKNMNGRIDISIFDKAAEWPFLVLRYPHSLSNAPYHQPPGVFQGQLVRFRIICNTLKNFKRATAQMVLRLLKRGHKAPILIKGWNAHLNKFNNDKITNYTALRRWFRRMLTWATYKHKETNKIWIPKTSNLEKNCHDTQNKTDQLNNFHPTHSLTKKWVPKHPLYPQNNSKIHQQSLQPQPPSSPLPLPTKSTKESHQTQHITINQINTKHATFDSSLFSFRNLNTPSMLVHQPTISSSLHSLTN